MTSMAGFNLLAPAGSSAEYMGLGDTVWVQDSCLQHVVASGAIAKNDLVIITNGGVASSATTANVSSVTAQAATKQLGIALYAFADGDRGTVLVGPFEKNPINNLPFLVNSESGTVATSPLYTSTNAGRVTNTVGSNVRIQNFALIADTVSGPAPTACRAVDRITAAGG